MTDGNLKKTCILGHLFEVLLRMHFCEILLYYDALQHAVFDFTKHIFHNMQLLTLLTLSQVSISFRCCLLAKISNLEVGRVLFGD